jgi:type II secretory pathway pseudopilin PulG
MGKIIKSGAGFALLELLVYVGILAVSAALLTGILSTALKVQTRESAANEVTGQLNFVMQNINRLVRESSLIEMATSTPTSALTLRMKDQTKGVTKIYLESGAVLLKEKNEATGVESISNLTNNRVVVDALNFTKFSQYPGHDTVSVDIQMTYNSQNPQQRQTRELRSAIARVSAATFDSNLLPGSASYTVGQSGSPWKNLYISNAINDLIYFSGGNVGIGATTPTAKLHVVGAFDQGGTTANVSAILGSAYNHWTYFGGNTSGRIRGSNEGYLVVDSYPTGTNNKLFLNFGSPGIVSIALGGGNVGIGTANPGAKLHVSAGDIRVSRESGDTTSAAIAIDQNNVASNNGRWVIASRNTPNLGLYNVGLGKDVMTMLPGGNVGIGTANPGAKLHVSAGDIRVSRESGDTTSAAIAIDQNNVASNNGRWVIASRNTPNLGLYNVGLGKDVMTMLPGGNVGIGTANPSERLHVIGNILKSGTVSFVEDYPGDPSKQIVYVSLEGPEVGTYIRGMADCQNNEATIVFPDYFRLVTGENGLTAQLTPRLKSINLYIKELNNEKLVVGCGDAGSFDYLVNGLRKGYENHQVVRSK